METKHAPGPWRAIAIGRTISIDAPDACGIAFINPDGEHDAGIPRKADMANARLIAAAPELLNALELAEATIERLERHAPGSANGTLDVIRAVIAKAKGR